MRIELAINVHFQRDRTPLIAACEERRSETAQLLIEKGADLNKQDEVCNTFLVLCCGVVRHCSHTEHIHQDVSLSPQSDSSICLCQFQYPFLCMALFYHILVVCPCVCDRCGRGCNEFAGRVQNHHMRLSFYRNGHINLS